MKQILVTGGTGFIGRPLCRALVAAGHHVTVLTRKPAKVRDKCGPGVSALASLDDWRPDMHFDAVINLAGEPIADAAWTARRKQQLRDSRIALTERLVVAMARAQHTPAVLLSGSAIGYYGDGGDRAFDESSPAAGDFAARLCADWENAALAAERLGVRVCLLRTGLVLDPSGGLLGRMQLPFRFGLGARLGNGRQWMSWIAIEDYLSIVQRLLDDDGARGPFNMTAPQPVTNASFTSMLAAALHRPALLFAPAPVLRLALGERAPMLLGGQRVLPARLQGLGYEFRQASLDGALRALLPPA